MEKFQGLILKLAETQPNGPLTPAAKTHVQDHSKQFFAHDYKMPDHPPYSAMIERALSELNEKGGSTEESISQFLEKEYKQLPLAHSAYLKHHLAKLCESGDIVATTRGNRYMLGGANPTLISSSKSRRKPSIKRKQPAATIRVKQVIKERDKVEATEKVHKLTDNICLL